MLFITRKLLFLSLILSIVAISCSSDDDVTTDPDEEGPDDEQLIIPDTYSFTRAGQSTVRIPGQVERIAMLEEIDVAFIDFDGSTYGGFSVATLNGLFTNDGSVTWTNSFLANTVLEGSGDLNTSSRQLRNTVADSEDYFEGPGNATEPAQVRAFLDDLIERQVSEVLPAITQEATPGNAGQLADGTSTRFVNNDGWEINEVFEKSLIGSLQLDQVVNNYIGANLLDQGTNREDNDNEVPRNDSGTDTQMEHFWDEGFGYIYGLSCDIEDVARDLGENDGNFNNYLDLVNDDEDFRGIADDIFTAFVTGRAAITASDYDLRDEQTAILRELLSEVMAIRTVFYLQQGRIKLESARAGTGGEFGDAFHDISEGMGFLLGLRYTQNPNTNAPYYTPEEVQGFFDNLLADGSNGLWDVESSTIDAVSEAIAAPFGFTRAMAESVDNAPANAPGCE